VGKGLLWLTTASATNSFISITGPINVKVAASHSRGWTHSIGIVSVFVYPTQRPLAKYLTVCSEGGQDCQKARDEAQANGMINSTGLSSANLTGSGSLMAMDLDTNTINDDYRGGRAGFDDWMNIVLM